jgi:predicted DNA-binding ArsR family transcriptional regulator
MRLGQESSVDKDPDKHMHTYMQVDNNANHKQNFVESLEKLADMKQKGILTDEEFQKLKSEIMKKVTTDGF